MSRLFAEMLFDREFDLRLEDRLLLRALSLALADFDIISESYIATAEIDLLDDEA